MSLITEWNHMLHVCSSGHLAAGLGADTSSWYVQRGPTGAPCGRGVTGEGQPGEGSQEGVLHGRAAVACYCQKAQDPRFFWDTAV